MQVINEVLPSDPERIAAMQAPGPEGPIVMVNLLRFRDFALYPDGSEPGLSGREAYERYGRAVAQLLPKFGGRALFAGDVSFLALGQVEDLWDEVALVRYPDRKALWDMSTSLEWQAISAHRHAGLAGQLNIECTASKGLLSGEESGEEFGEARGEDSGEKLAEKSGQTGAHPAGEI